MQILSLVETQLPGLIAFDANSGPQTLSDILTHCVKRQIPSMFFFLSFFADISIRFLFLSI